MKGFVVFSSEELLQKFLDSAELSLLQLEEKMVRSSRDPLIILNDLSPTELKSIGDLANEFGGEIEESSQFYPLQEQ